MIAPALACSYEMSLMPSNTMTHRTPGSASTSGSRCSPDSPAPSDASKRFEPIPALTIATGVPSASAGSRAERRSGQPPFVSVVEHAPSVIESPSATMVTGASGASTSTCDTNSTCVVVFVAKPVGAGIVPDETKLPVWDR